MKVTIIPTVIGALGTVTKGLLQGLEDLEITGFVETTKLHHNWDQPEYWEESWRLEETGCHSNSRRKPSANADEKENLLIIKTRHDWVGKMIHWELCKKIKSDHTNNWYVQIRESIQENETHRLYLDFEIQTDHLISAGRPVINNKKKRKKKRKGTVTLLFRLNTN